MSSREGERAPDDMLVSEKGIGDADIDFALNA
jgi:hypothetical protein